MNKLTTLIPRTQMCVWDGDCVCLIASCETFPSCETYAGERQCLVRTWVPRIPRSGCCLHLDAEEPVKD